MRDHQGSGGGGVESQGEMSRILRIPLKFVVTGGELGSQKPYLFQMTSDPDQGDTKNVGRRGGRRYVKSLGVVTGGCGY